MVEGGHLWQGAPSKEDREGVSPVIVLMQL